MGMSISELTRSGESETNLGVRQSRVRLGPHLPNLLGMKAEGQKTGEDVNVVHLIIFDAVVASNACRNTFSTCT